MGFLGSLTGSNQRRTLEASNAAAQQHMGTAYRQAQGSYDQADSYYRPYAEGGQRANALYQDANGMNGADGGVRANAAYGHASNPYLRGQQDRTENALMRTMAQRGMNGSGTAALAAARSRDEMGYQDYQNWLGRVGGMQGQGLGVASQRAGLQQNLGNLHMGYGQSMAGNAINFGNAMSQAQGIGVNNLFRYGEMMASVAKSAAGGGGG